MAGIFAIYEAGNFFFEKKPVEFVIQKKIEGSMFRSPPQSIHDIQIGS